MIHKPREEKTKIKFKIQDVSTLALLRPSLPIHF